MTSSDLLVAEQSHLVAFSPTFLLFVTGSLSAQLHRVDFEALQDPATGHYMKEGGGAPRATSSLRDG